MSKNLIVKKEKNKYQLYLNEKIYSKKLVQKAISGETWVNSFNCQAGYFVLDLGTNKKTDVLELVNYLLYVHRSS